MAQHIYLISLLVKILNILKNYNMKFLFLSLILLFSFVAFSQSQADSVETEPIDTAYTHPIGFLLGGGITFGNITPSNINSADTFSSWGTKPQRLFSVGLMFNKDFSSKLSFQTGTVFKLSKMVFDYRLNGYNYNDTTNYSTLAIPFLASYKLNDKPSGLKLTAGLLSEFDISKKADRNNRVFPLKVISPAAYGAIGYQLKTYTSIIEFKLFAQVNPLNLITNDENKYTQAIDKLYYWRTGFVVILR